MCCLTLTALAAPMPTTELTRAVRHQGATPWLPQYSDHEPVRMNWVVVIDHSGKRQLRMHWDTPSKDD